MLYTFISEDNNSINKNFEFILLTTDKKKSNSNCCILVDKPENISKQNLIACNSKNINSVCFWINKKCNFVINPFDDKNRYFDNSTINVMKQNNIFPVILLNELEKYNAQQSIYFLKNAFFFSELCKKQKLPIIIDSGLKKDKKTNQKQEIVLYELFGYTKEQGIMFNKMIFSDIL